MIKQRYVVGMLGTNCYVIADENTKEAAVIDPGDEDGKIAAGMEREGLIPKMILLTHGHDDHTGAVDALCDRYDMPVYLHPADRGGPRGLFYNGLTPTEPLAEGDVLKLGGLEIKVMNTPGHSEGSCVFLVENEMFCGDTLFAGSCGRTDFPGGNRQKMMASLRRLYDLPGNYNVYPGHMSGSTLDNERRGNFYMKEFSRG